MAGLWGPHHLLQDELFLVWLKIDLYDSGCEFGVVVGLQNESGADQMPPCWYFVTIKQVPIPSAQSVCLHAG